MALFLARPGDLPLQLLLQSAVLLDQLVGNMASGTPLPVGAVYGNSFINRVPGHLASLTAQSYENKSNKLCRHFRKSAYVSFSFLQGVFFFFFLKAMSGSNTDIS